MIIASVLEGATTVCGLSVFKILTADPGESCLLGLLCENSVCFCVSFGFIFLQIGMIAVFLAAEL